jgi:hypothetical protein
MTPAILFVTMSFYGQPTTNSQTRFESMDACEDARIKLMTDAENSRRKARAAEAMRTPLSSAQPTKEPTPPPMVSAIAGPSERPPFRMSITVPMAALAQLRASQFSRSEMQDIVGHVHKLHATTHAGSTSVTRMNSTATT